jgi:hypothetical protein
MDLVEAIVGTWAGQAAMMADYDPDNATPPPYIAVSEGESKNIYLAFNHESRVDEIPVQFACFAKTRAEVVTILDAIESAYQNTTLATDDWTVIGPPVIEFRKTFWGLDQFGGLLEMVFTTQA